MDSLYFNSMLTKNDLAAIKKIIRETVREELELEIRSIRDDLESRIILSTGEIKLHISKLEDRVKNVELDVREIKKSVKTVKYHVSKLAKDVSVVIKVSDESTTILRKRVDRIEDHIHIS